MTTAAVARTRHLKTNRDVDETDAEEKFSFDLNFDPVTLSPIGSVGDSFPGSGIFGRGNFGGDRFGEGTRSGRELISGSFGLRDQLGAFDFVDEHTAVLVPTHMNSGLAQPGSTITLEVYNARGERIAETSVVADTGGNWLATFPMDNIDSQPTRIVMKQTWAAHNDGNDTGYNFRTYSRRWLAAHSTPKSCLSTTLPVNALLPK